MAMRSQWRYPEYSICKKHIEENGNIITMNSGYGQKLCEYNKETDTITMYWYSEELGHETTVQRRRNAFTSLMGKTTKYCLGRSTIVHVNDGVVTETIRYGE